MTRVDFYLLSDTDEDGRHLAVCRLTQKAYKLKHRVYILTETPAESEHLDRLLWTFNPGSFVPHQMQGEPIDERLPVLIGHAAPPAEFKDVLITLAPQVPEFFDRFERVAELVGSNESERGAARERFRIYRERGATVQTHNL